MNGSLVELLETVVENDYCIGCGICASVENSPLSMKLNEDGKYVPYLSEENLMESSNDYTSVCPFSQKNNVESLIGQAAFGNFEGIHLDDYSGYHLKSYAGYVQENDYRDKGSSGGMGSWIAAKLLETNRVDGIIHVKSSVNKNDVLFDYQVSSDIESLSHGAKSKYYPIEMSQVLKFVKENQGRYAIIGIPCYIKGVRLLEKQDPIIKERIKYHIGLVCGHLKSDMFAKSIGWQLGIEPDKLEYIDFRKKLPNRAANDYGVAVRGKNEEYIAPTKSLYTTNWGQGFFKYNACEFCDDVLAETADVTVGDAWLPEYSEDTKGTNVIVVRHPDIQKIFEEHEKSVYLEEIDSEKVYQSQAGGFRHRREGLSYRLYLKDEANEWRPLKRVEPSNKHTKKRKKIFGKRYNLSKESFNAYKIAKEKGDFQAFINYMDPLVKDYQKLVINSFPKKAASKIKRELKNIIQK